MSTDSLQEVVLNSPPRVRAGLSDSLAPKEWSVGKEK